MTDEALEVPHGPMPATGATLTSVLEIDSLMSAIVCCGAYAERAGACGSNQESDAAVRNQSSNAGAVRKPDGVRQRAGFRESRRLCEAQRRLRESRQWLARLFS